MYIIVRRRRWLFASECTTQSTPLFDFSNCLLIMGADSFDSNYTFSINCRRRDSERARIYKYKIQIARQQGEKEPFPRNSRRQITYLHERPITLRSADKLHVKCKLWPLANYLWRPINPARREQQIIRRSSVVVNQIFV